MTSPTSDGSTTETDRALETVAQRILEGISSHAIFKLDTEGVIDSWSNAAQSIYGYDAEIIRNEHFSVLFADEEGPNPDLEAVLTQAKSDDQELEHWHKRADNSVFWASMTVSPIHDDRFKGYAVISQDTTVKKQYEQMLERQNDRLKEFTDILAHDLRNPLNSIDGRLELYRDTRDEEHIAEIEATTDRMKRLVDDLLRVARQGNVVTDPGQTDLKTVVDKAWEGTGRLSEAASFEYDTIPSVAADHDRLCELFENLFRNAIEHAGAEITVRVGPFENGFYIEDNGPGIPTDIRDEVFDHGFTTKASGSGYGLSVVRTITNAHGWDIQTTESESGGARFEITGVDFLD